MGTAVALEASVAAAVAAARAAQREWAGTSLEARSRVSSELARLVRARAEEIADVVVAETGKPGTEAIAHDLYGAVDRATWLARNAPRVLRDERMRFSQLHLKTKRAWIVHEPIGIVAAITPWNIPFGIPFVQVAAAVAAGNGVVLKPSEHTPLSGGLIPSLFEAAGAVPGLVQVVHGDGSAGAALVDDPSIGKVFFTGSAAAGRSVAAAAGARGCPVVLELGGRDPLVVFADADADRAVEGALFASFMNAGQACVSAERIFVERSLYEDFRARLERRARALRLGDDLGPLVLEGELREPAVVDGPLADEEIFGPVVSIEAFADEDDAVRRANDTRYGLAASVWSRDLEKARRVARRIEAGMVWVNDFGYSFAAGEAPWGGVKASGFGRTSGVHGLRECVNVKLVDEDAGRLRPAWWFPYDPATERALRSLLDVLYGGRVERARAAWRHRRDLVHLVRRSLNR
jgi:acyl-CoA reductase-like NAD-dependent aldehyde dehydrogenase